MKALKALTIVEAQKLIDGNFQVLSLCYFKLETEITLLLILNMNTLLLYFFLLLLNSPPTYLPKECHSITRNDKQS